MEHQTAYFVFERLLDSYYYWGLIIIIFFDWLTGTLKSRLWHVTDSAVGWKGAAKHSVVIIGMGLVWSACISFNSEAVAVVITTMYGLNYLISILENFAVMGIYTPKFLIVKVKSEQRRYEEKLADALGVDVDEVRGGNVPEGALEPVRRPTALTDTQAKDEEPQG